MRWMALVIGAIGVAAFATCTPPEGKPCTTHDECELREYCEAGLGACVRWSSGDPSCRPACPHNRYCSHGLCYSRFSAITITSPAPGAVTGRTFDASFSVTLNSQAPDSGTLQPYVVAFWLESDSFGSGGQLFPRTLEHTHSFGPFSVDASVRLTLSLENTGLSSGPVQVFVDQTR